MYSLSKTKLLFDLYYAFQCAKKHKASKEYVKVFERNLHENLIELRDELFERRYKPQPSVCFIITEPKKREIFAANFRDRIVHHLYYNYTYEMFDKTFIEDSYSCRKGKGTHYGIHRLEKHIRQESENYTKETYVLKMDIKGYFIHINRPLLLSLVNTTLDKMKPKYCNELDFDFLKYLSKVIVLLNPVENCIVKSNSKEWTTLDKSKSLFYSNVDCGLPIGNLTSQLYSNVYLNALDQYMKRVLHCKHYGRYVDDFYVVSKDKEFLKSIIKEIKEFMMNSLHLEIQNKKTNIINIKYGVEFLGAFIKPYRTYISNKTVRRMNKNLYQFQVYGTNKDVKNMVNSYLGIFSHYKSNKVKKEVMNRTPKIQEYGHFIDHYSKFV
jgi:retron-type reverse transcriptase